MYIKVQDCAPPAVSANSVCSGESPLSSAAHLGKLTPTPKLLQWRGPETSTAAEMSMTPRLRPYILLWVAAFVLLALMFHSGEAMHHHKKHKKIMKVLLAHALLKKRVIPIPIPFHQESHHTNIVPVPNPIPFKVPVHTIHKHHHHTKHVHHHKHTKGRNTLLILDRQHERGHHGGGYHAGGYGGYHGGYHGNYW
ncbi:uncharacterized protein LOC142776667 [Rhipicephalus microplus]|uniref:uncharacterized protein LOC142776667 n=1 Tax=Rhipicephalus microplus TaxID=6941 RepID=UPI003F6A5E44